MTTEHQETQEETAYWRLLEQKKETFSEAARTVLSEAYSAAYAAHMVHNYCFQDEEHEEAMDKMRLAAVELTNRDRRLLGKLWRAALAAAASIDADDYETLVGYRVYRPDLHWYYRMLSGMVEKILQEKRFEELRLEIAESEQKGIVDDSEPPF